MRRSREAWKKLFDLTRIRKKIFDLSRSVKYYWILNGQRLNDLNAEYECHICYIMSNICVKILPDISKRNKYIVTYFYFLLYTP